MKSMQLPKMSSIKPKAVFSSNTADSDCPNHLKQNFNPSAPNQVWVSDITYIRVGNRFCFLCIVIDLFARKVIAYRLSSKMNVQLTIDTFQAAWNIRGKPSGLLFHSDRGCQYTAKEFRKLIDSHDVVQSFSAKGHPYDNAVAESFFKFLKLEETNRKSYSSLNELQLSLFSYIHFYNTLRPHGSNAYLTPDEKEIAFRKGFSP
jgi:putative transposase